MVLRWWFHLDLFVDFLVLVTFSLCLPLVLLRGLGSWGCAPATPRRRCWRGCTPASAATSTATCGDSGFLTSGFLEAGHDPVGPTDRHLSKTKVKKGLSNVTRKEGSYIKLNNYTINVKNETIT